ncbi:hypothetical protein L596_009368 [Steinernema carpocapsae]|uniref:Uncharacterized protein n=1 Tax=Steinernema carpocapsae TaxID=34508 RepID=A0A4V6XWM2_STECR|nr:hypothetical protein L596_009368 [Steinernema carpocapsae]
MLGQYEEVISICEKLPASPPVHLLLGSALVLQAKTLAASQEQIDLLRRFFSLASQVLATQGAITQGFKVFADACMLVVEYNMERSDVGTPFPWNVAEERLTTDPEAEFLAKNFGRQRLEDRLEAGLAGRGRADDLRDPAPQEEMPRSLERPRESAHQELGCTDVYETARQPSRTRSSLAASERIVWTTATGATWAT